MSSDVTASLDLVRRAQAGDSKAFEELLARYYPRVLRIVRVRMGGGLRPATDSQDILQNTFMAAVRCFDRFEVRGEGSLIHWFARIAEHQIGDAADRAAAQKRKRAGLVSLDMPPEETDGGGMDVPAPPKSPLDEAAQVEHAKLVEAALQKLSPLHRELILLRDYAACDWQEIAALTGRPSADAARMMHGTAMVELAKHLLRRTGGPDGAADGDAAAGAGAGGA